MTKKVRHRSNSEEDMSFFFLFLFLFFFWARMAVLFFLLILDFFFFYIYLALPTTAFQSVGSAPVITHQNVCVMIHRERWLEKSFICHSGKQ
ncbi:hypothetical protein ACQKWADRAFT_11787 [Trichoderma austrokoningii]